MATHIDIDGGDVMDYLLGGGKGILDYDIIGEVVDAAVARGIPPAEAVKAALAAAPAIVAQMQPGANAMAVFKQPWRKGRVAPGADMPHQKVHMLPLTPSANNGVFTAAFTAIEFAARPQKAFRGRRLIAELVRTAGAVGQLIAVSTIFVGVQPQQAQIGNLSLGFFQAGAFEMELEMEQAEPGIDIRLPCIVVGAAIPAGESITVNIAIKGDTIA